VDKAEEFLGSVNLEFVEGLYSDYLADRRSVPEAWRAYFEKFEESGGNGHGPARVGPSFQPSSLFNPPAPIQRTSAPPTTALQDRVDQLIRSYRVRGHMAAQLDPLGRPRPEPPELDPSLNGFTDADMDGVFSCQTIQKEPLSLREIVDRLRATYCRSIGVQFMHIDNPMWRFWLQTRMESTQNRIALDRKEQLRILTRLTDAVIFEEFIRKKFVGAKSFSLEGAESLIPLLDLAIEKSGEQGVDEIVVGMAHRGRLNVLANVMGKHPRDIFREFEDRDPHEFTGRGDVKYHLGHSTDWRTSGGRKIHLSLAFNPSHLGFVGPVALGRMRAKQDRVGDRDRLQGTVFAIHGDAAFAGEGTTQETLNLSRLPAYSIGGALHVIVNNQIGFTTPPEEGRSSPYATDVARMLQIPIFHVNGEDPEAVAQVIRLALDFKRQFRSDVVVDMYCYRRLGHNEADEPAFTQPLMYRAIEQRKSVREGYLEHLLKLGEVTRQEADQIAVDRTQRLEQALAEARSESYRRPSEGLLGIWSGYVGGADNEDEEADTGIDRPRLSSLLDAQTRLPAGFHAHPKILRFLEHRQQMARGEKPLDWSAGEALAFASIATEGYRIRLTGQDSERGTFSQRHSVIHDHDNGDAWCPLQHLAPDQAPVEIANSPLSEVAVLGFDYGYSLDTPDGLVMWEAQFGDFANVAQVIIDQFIVSAEDKWRRLSGIVLLLPHGFEGMGPEHSSARLERFLNLSAEDNIQVVYPTTPAQYFHCLRRQVAGRWRKPLIVMTPKSLLRHPRAISTLDACAQGRFYRVLPDVLGTGNAARRVLMCTGKIYFDLEERREKTGRNDVAIIRLEQLYPLSERQLRAALEPYQEGTPLIWVQEEPENMGAWRFLRIKLGDQVLSRFPFSGLCRPASASPATGSAASHRREQEEMLSLAFA
jgi:2-oxoglutarate dehydrogenase E1 component